MYETYKLSPESQKPIRNKTIFYFSGMMVLILGIIALDAYFDKDDQPQKIQSLIVIVIVALLSSIWVVGSMLKRTKQVLESYCFTITDQWVQREQYKAPAIRIRHEDIQFIIKHNDGGFTIKGASQHDIISISRFAGPYAQLEQSLQQIKPFTDFSPAGNFFIRFQIVVSLLVATLGMIVLMANNKWLVGICGSVLSVYLLWYLIQQKRNSNMKNAIHKYRISYVLLLGVIWLTMAFKLLV
jgi:hypothetical protein